VTSELDVSPADGAAEMRQGWIEKVASTLLSYRESAEPVGAPNEMISDAAQKAFKVSTALGLIPGPLGVAAILPEVAVLTRLQINLIYRIAKYHGRDESADSTIVLLILANVLGVAGGEVLIRRAGSTLVVRSANSRIIKSLARRIGTRIIDTAAEKAVGRWIPMLTAPLFGYLSRSLTLKIGREADRILSRPIRSAAPES